MKQVLDPILALLLLANLMVRGIVPLFLTFPLSQAFTGAALFAVWMQHVIWIGSGLAAVLALLWWRRAAAVLVTLHVAAFALIKFWTTEPNSPESVRQTEVLERLMQDYEASAETAVEDDGTAAQTVSYTAASRVYTYPNIYTYLLYAFALLYVWIIRPRLDGSRDPGEDGEISSP
jgi:hypothetical protein